MMAAEDAGPVTTTASTDALATNPWGTGRNRGVSTGGGTGRGGARSSRGAGWSALGTAAVAQHSSRLMFEMFYLTDEILYYALKHEGYVGEFALRLANLVYSVVFRHEVRGQGGGGRRPWALVGTGDGVWESRGGGWCSLRRSSGWILGAPVGPSTSSVGRTERGQDHLTRFDLTTCRRCS